MRSSLYWNLKFKKFAWQIFQWQGVVWIRVMISGEYTEMKGENKIRTTVLKRCWDFIKSERNRYSNDLFMYFK